ncbi:hypothetical protein CFOL_v3_04786 [Cephalotus follicularis]|uniref:Uncharacterized protein n=1 Tax=Cephalotus follicularis TaxID=3775 RepID=A0A1Q3AZV7_CEPFO|nr:hypothetical protein CFOL_v3_04786 [Cephalotus follicularis]
MPIKEKSVRKGLKELSNNENENKNNGGGKYPKSAMKMKKIDKYEAKIEKVIEEHNDDSLDHLLLVHSDLSSLIRQIDELIVLALKHKTISKQGQKDIETFTDDLSKALSSLKPWFPRFQKVLSSPLEFDDQLRKPLNNSETVSAVNEDEMCEVESPEKSKLSSLISPSPLVSWRPNRSVERNRQVFLLTPLPVSKALFTKPDDSYDSEFKRIASNTTVGLPSFFNMSGDTNDELLEGLAVKPTPRKPSNSVAVDARDTLECRIFPSPMISGRDHSVLVMTPCLQRSPPKSCLLLEPLSKSAHRGNNKIHKSTPFPVGIQSCSGFSESSGSEAPDDLGLKYPELLGIQHPYRSGVKKKELDTSPNWLFSPPKSCVLLEPPDEKSNIPIDHHLPFTSCILNQQENLSVLNEYNVQGVCNRTKKESVGGGLALIESTPLWKEQVSTIRTGKRPGENTLKKELWTRFDAATTHAVRYNASTFHKTAKKGFLDMLEEASCDKENQFPMV